jgi:hypothetical protein
MTMCGQGNKEADKSLKPRTVTLSFRPKEENKSVRPIELKNSNY